MVGTKFYSTQHNVKPLLVPQKCFMNSTLKWIAYFLFQLPLRLWCTWCFHSRAQRTRSYKHNQNIALKCWYCFIKALYYGYAETRLLLYITTTCLLTIYLMCGNSGNHLSLSNCGTKEYYANIISVNNYLQETTWLQQ